MSADRPVTGPDLTPEQRETLAIAIHNANRCNCDSGEGDRMKADEVAPVVARMLADAEEAAEARAARQSPMVSTLVERARAEGDRQGAARVVKAVEATLAREPALGHRFLQDYWKGYADIRAALAQAAHTPKETADE